MAIACLATKFAATTLQDKQTNNPTTTATAKAKCHILALPAELRLIIYDFYFASFELDTTRVTPYSDVQAPLLRTCQVIRREGLDTYEARLRKTKSERYQQVTEDIEHYRVLRDGTTDYFVWRSYVQTSNQLDLSRSRTSEALGLEIQRVRKVREEEVT